MLSIETFTFNPFQENTYILYNENKEAAIIDPGAYDVNEKKRLDKYIHDNKLQVKYLLNTHCHIDHVFAEKYVSDKYEVEPYMHSSEEEILQGAKSFADQFGLAMEEYKGKLHFIDESDIIKIGDDELSIILAPGHSPGSICFYCAAQHFLIGGDVLFRESIGRTDLYKGSYEQLLQSIKEKIFTLPNNTIVYPGHGTHTTIEHEKNHNPFLI